MNLENTSVDFVFICGAVGSGNTFLFECLANNRKLYGVNEDGVGALLSRLQQSEDEFGFCPHSLSAFVDFMYALKANRDTLLFKTPSNLAHMEKLLDAVPNSRFIVTYPRATILDRERNKTAPTGSSIRGSRMGERRETCARGT